MIETQGELFPDIAQGSMSKRYLERYGLSLKVVELVSSGRQNEALHFVKGEPAALPQYLRTAIASR